MENNYRYDNCPDTNTITNDAFNALMFLRVIKMEDKLEQLEKDIKKLMDEIRDGK